MINAEQRRKELGHREKQIEVGDKERGRVTRRLTLFLPKKKLEQEIKSAKQQLALTSLTKQGYDAEMNDLIRSRTELQCTIDDLQAAEEQGQERREELEAELEVIETKITEMEAELMEIVPEYQDRVKEEKDEKRK